MEINESPQFMCCFCNELIESSQYNPTDINICINIDKPSNKQYSQDFYCHINCIRDKIHPDIKLHFHLHNILDN